jgi:hypothetical protein
VARAIDATLSGMRARALCYAVVAAAAAALSGEAAAETPNEPATTLAVPAAPRTGPSAEAFPRIDEYTALTVGERRLKVGVLFFDYGITEHLSVGSTPPAWALRAFTSILVPNLNVKYQFFAREPVWLAAQVAAYYANITKDEASGQVLDVPLSLFATVRATRHLFLHGEGAYLFVRGFGNGDLNRADIGGTMAARAVQGQLLAEVRVLRWLSLTGLGRYQFYTSSLVLSGSGNVDSFTTASVDAELTPRVRHPWELVGGVALLFKHVHASVGGGYGYYFVPGMELPLQKRTFIPQASLSFLFTI